MVFLKIPPDRTGVHIPPRLSSQSRITGRISGPTTTPIWDTPSSSVTSASVYLVTTGPNRSP